MGSRLLIFCWHNVSATAYFGSPGAEATEGFRQQMKLLKRLTTPVSLPDALQRLSEGRPLPPRASAVTFDDGYRDNLQVAAPILRDGGIPATFFLVPAFLSSGEAPWWERLAWAVRSRRRTDAAVWMDVPILTAGGDQNATLEALAAHLKTLDETGRQQSLKDIIELLDPAGEEPLSPMMDWDEARRLADMGYTIGSHSRRHAILANEPAEEQYDDLRVARTVLEEGIGLPVELLAYPNGDVADFTDATLRAARQAGYRAAVTTIDGWNGPETEPLALHRFVMYPERGSVGFAVVGRHLARDLRRRARLTRHLR